MEPSSGEPDDCVICLTPLDSADYETLICGHQFHIHCLQEVVNNAKPPTTPSKCPLCRQLTVTVSPKTRLEYPRTGRDFYNQARVVMSMSSVPEGWVRYYCSPRTLERGEEYRSWIQYDPMDMPSYMYAPLYRHSQIPPPGYGVLIFNSYSIFLRNDVRARDELPWLFHGDTLPARLPYRYEPSMHTPREQSSHSAPNEYVPTLKQLQHYTYRGTMKITNRIISILT